MFKTLLLAFSLMMASTAASASTITLSKSGVFTGDNDFAFLNFTIAAPMDFSAESFSWAAGGFDPVITLFQFGQRIAQNDDGGVGLDSKITNVRLLAGKYGVALTQFANFPTKVGNLFTQSNGISNFNGRTGAYAFDVTLSTVPVPAAGILFASALFGAGFIGRRKKKAKTAMMGAFARAS